MSEFQKFSKVVHDRYAALAAGELFVVGTDNKAFSDAYLAAFPEGTNPVYKTNTEHDCSCCKNFVRHLGNVVSIKDGKVSTVWDTYPSAPYPYDVVGAKMREFVLSQPITGVFRTAERQYGAEKTHQDLGEGKVKVWNHFHGRVESRHHTRDVGTQVGNYNAAVQVFRRGLDELTREAVLTVRDLIDANALYRGQEHLPAMAAFSLLQAKYKALTTPAERELYVWEHASAPAARFRNTVIGTLVQDLSAGVDEETAIRSFETKVAPQNYKRPTALITPTMVKQAMATITELGLEPALQRRFAKVSDISVNNVLWVNNSTRKHMANGLEDVLMSAAATRAPKELRAEDITIDDFMKEVLPTCSSVELLVQSQHINNFMSLTAPVHADAPALFKWDNNFAWSYNGNITDSIKEKVKAAGGNVTNAKLRVSLAWFNYDDLDIHVIEPNGHHIYFGNKSGKLDVDMNAGGGSSRTPVENVSWITVQNGVYHVQINQYHQRETDNPGCVVEIENNGKLMQLSYAKPLRGNIKFASITVVNGQITDVKPGDGVLAKGISMDKWGVKTETFVKVNTLVHSPNYWDDNAVGNKHWFFILENCANPDPARGVYNEFLSSNLEKHRKVFEVLGDKTKCPPTEDQLSGLGFSSTRGDTVTVRVVAGNHTQNFNITF